MKGIVFNLLEECVRETYGEDTWDALLDAANVNGVYTSMAVYPDEQLDALVVAASAMFLTSREDFVRWFGQRAVKHLSNRYPEFFQLHFNTRSFLLALNHVVHPEVRKLSPDASPPHFTFERHAGGGLLMHYQSRRRLCTFAEGLIKGAAVRFGETVTIEQPVCVARGAPHCTFVLTFTAATE